MALRSYEDPKAQPKTKPRSNLDIAKQMAQTVQKATAAVASQQEMPKIDLSSQIEELRKREGGYTAPEQEAMWSQMALRANAQQQAAQRALAARQAQMGVQGGAGSAQLARQQQMFAAQKAMAGQELGIRNIDEISKRFRERQEIERQQQFANAAAQALRLQLQEAAATRESQERIAREQAKAQKEAAGGGKKSKSFVSTVADFTPLGPIFRLFG